VYSLEGAIAALMCDESDSELVAYLWKENRLYISMGFIVGEL